MNCEIKTEHREAFKVIGPAIETAMDTAYEEWPKFWNERLGKYARLWQGVKPGNAEERAVVENMIGCYGVSIEKENGKFTYMIAGEYKGGEIPDNMMVFEFPESDWIKFTAKGKCPEALQKLNNYIWGEWCAEHKEYAMSIGASLEFYSCGDIRADDYEFGIWLPVIKK